MRPPEMLYEFGSFRLNINERLLQRNGTTVPLTPKLVDMLVIMVQKNGHLLTKEELMQALWPDTFVEESSLTQNISLLRKALAENGDSQQYIETLPKRGYRFVADVRVSGPFEANLTPADGTSLTTDYVAVQSVDSNGSASVEAQPLTGWAVNRRSFAFVIAAILLAAFVTVLFFRKRLDPSMSAELVPKSIAVLPFKTIGPATDADLMSVGMADAVILQMARFNKGTVLPTSSVFKFTNHNQDAFSIGQKLGVEAVLDGTVQIDGDRVRVTAQLIRTADGKTLWSEKFDRPYSGIFALQDSISGPLATSVMTRIHNANETHEVGRTTDNAEAYQAYLMGMHFWNRRTKDNLAKAIQYLEQAVSKDPNFPRARALLADCYYLSGQNAFQLIPRDESLTRAAIEATKALELDETISEAHVTRAGVAYSNKRYEEANRAYRRALELNPNYAVGHLRYGYFLFANSNLEEALAEMRLAQKLDPVSPTSNIALGYLQFMSRDFHNAIISNKIALELLPDSPAARFNLGQVYAHKRMFPQALAEFEQLAKTEPGLAARGKISAYGLSGRTDEARQMLKEFLSKSNKHQTNGIERAVLFTNIGETNLALASLEEVVKTYSDSMHGLAARLKYDPQLDPLRGEQRFQEFLRMLEGQGMKRSM